MELREFIEMNKEIRYWHAKVFDSAHKTMTVNPGDMFGLLDTYNTLAIIILDLGHNYKVNREAFKPLLVKLVDDSTESVRRIVNSEKDMYDALIRLLKKWEINYEVKTKDIKEEVRENE